MVELDYIFEDNTLRTECQNTDILSDTSLKYDIQMPVRLLVGGTEVFDLTTVKFINYTPHVHLPSSAWDYIPVLQMAAFVDEHFLQLREQGYCDIIFLDPDLRLTLHGDIVRVSYFFSGAPYGEAPYEEIYNSFSIFSERVRHDFLAVCPVLQEHIELGAWFRRGGMSS